MSLISAFSTATTTTTGFDVYSSGSFVSYSGEFSYGKPKVLVIGAGGIGSNLAFLLATQNKYDVTVVDDDIADSKFYDRFIFKANNEIGIPKVEAVKTAVEKAGKFIKIYNNKFEDLISDINFKIFNFQYIFITVDNIESRKQIEHLIKPMNGIVSRRLIHVGCNLNSVSIYKTAMDLIGDDTPLLEGTSYDVVPDTKTYLRACVAVLEEIDSPIEVFNEFLPKQISSIPINDAMEGWSIIEYDGVKLLGKKVQICLKGLYKNSNLYRIKEDCPYNLVFDAFLACTLNKSFYLFNPDGTHLKNPHTMIDSHLCTGDIQIPRNPTYMQLKEVISQIADSLEIPNLDSAVRTNFGNIDLDSEFIKEWCILESEGHGNTWSSTIIMDEPGHIEHTEVSLGTGIISSEDLEDSELPMGFYEEHVEEPYVVSFASDHTVSHATNGGIQVVFATHSGELLQVPIESMQLSRIATNAPEGSDQSSDEPP